MRQMFCIISTDVVGRDERTADNLLRRHRDVQNEIWAHSVQIDSNTTNGANIFRAPIGTRNFEKEFIVNLALKWSTLIDKLPTIANVYQTAAFADLINFVRMKWIHSLRTCQCEKEWLTKLNSALKTSLLPALAEFQLTLSEKSVRITDEVLTNMQTEKIKMAEVLPNLSYDGEQWTSSNLNGISLDDNVESSQALMFERTRIRVLAGEREHVQKKTFTKWINSHLNRAEIFE
ncbi:hypothetical protein GJ496_004962 [Pomphorhynchus laevis]|nr:hypothetical protein GJ496_004962 [Pomphorhynchus laevis]